MKDFWQLKQAISNKFVETYSGEKPNPALLKAHLKRILEKGGREDKLKLLLQNSVYNYRTDNALVDPEVRQKFADCCKRWKEWKAGYLINYYTDAALEVKKHKKSKENPPPPHPMVRIFTVEEFQKFFAKSKLIEDDKLVRFQLVYFQIPSLRTLKLMFKELRVDRFDHMGSLREDEFAEEKEQACEEVMQNEEGIFEYLNCFKFGIPTGIRYKFMRAFLNLEDQPSAKKASSSEQLEETEAELLKVFFKSDTSRACNETSFFPFDDTLLEFGNKLVTEKEILFDENELPEEKNLYFPASGNPLRPACRIIPVQGFSKYLGLFTFFSKKKEKVFGLVKFFLKTQVSKLFQIDALSSENIIGLSIIFERLFIKNMNGLYMHLRSLNIYPIDLAFPWMLFFFTGSLSTEQVWILLDRLIGYNSNLLLPLVALGVFRYYEKILMNVRAKEEVEETFQRMGYLNVMALIQGVLF